MKLLYVHERLGALAGAEASAPITATELGRRGHTLFILHRSSTGKNETGWDPPFSHRFALTGSDTATTTRKALAAFEPDVIYVHKMADLAVISSLVESGCPLVRMVDDPEPPFAEVTASRRTA